MAQAGFLGEEIAIVMGVRRGDEGEGFHDLQAEAREAGAFFGVIGEEAHFRNTQVSEDLGAGAILPLIGGKAESEVGFDGIQAFFLQAVGVHFREEADAPAFLVDVD